MEKIVGMLFSYFNTQASLLQAIYGLTLAWN